MKDSEVIQKLINEVVSQRIAFKALLGVLANRFDPDHPLEENARLIEEWDNSTGGSGPPNSGPDRASASMHACIARE